MSFKKIVLLAIFVAIFSGIFAVNVQPVKATTPVDLQAMIEQLRVQIIELQRQLAVQQGQPATFCYDFNSNLGFAQSGTAAVRALHTALEKEGFSSGSDSADGTYTEKTSSAVVGFQQKYRSDVLAPYGLQFGTGYVGRTTRAKLNALYGCDVVQSPSLTPAPITITILSPNGGQQLERGSAYSIIWNSSGYASTDKIRIAVVDVDDSGKGNPVEYDLVYNLPSYTGEYTWKVSDTFVVGKTYKIEVEICGVTKCYSDKSDNYFSIVSTVTTTPSITILSPTGGETWIVGNGYDVQWEGFPTKEGRDHSFVLLDDTNIFALDSAGKFGGNTSAVYLSAAMKPGVYRLQLTVIDGETRVFDESDGYITVVGKQKPLWDWDYCTTANQCTVGQGDCDTDADCATGLRCAQDVGARYGQVSTMDVCETKGAATPSITNFNYTETDAYSGSLEFSWASIGADGVELQISCHSGLTIADAVTGANFSCGDIDRSLSISGSKYLKLTNTSDTVINVTATLTPVINHRGYPTATKAINFSLIPTITPSITILSPTGGETWIVGNGYDVQWEGFPTKEGRDHSFVLLDDTNIFALDSAGKFGGNTSAVYLSAAMKPGVYRLQLTVIDGETRVFDESDGYITVVGKATTTRISPCNLTTDPLIDMYMGDVTGDGYVSQADIDSLQKYIAGIIGGDIFKNKGDVNGDGTVNSLDITLLERYIAGVDTTFPVCSI